MPRCFHGITYSSYAVQEGEDNYVGCKGSEQSLTSPPVVKNLKHEMIWYGPRAILDFHALNRTIQPKRKQIKPWTTFFGATGHICQMHASADTP